MSREQAAPLPWSHLVYLCPYHLILSLDSVTADYIVQDVGNQSELGYDLQRMISADSAQVTTDPISKHDAKVEGAGIVNSDSLANESLQHGGDFAANGASVASIKQPAKSTTTNTTDTSAATKLDAAPNAGVRHDGQGSVDGTHTGTEHHERHDHHGNHHGGHHHHGGHSQHTGTANPDHAAPPASKPKGENLKEGGFDSSAPNASYSTAIGTKKDPGRVAVHDAAAHAVEHAGDAGRPKDKVLSRDGQYDVLDETKA